MTPSEEVRLAALRVAIASTRQEWPFMPDRFYGSAARAVLAALAGQGETP